MADLDYEVQYLERDEGSGKGCIDVVVMGCTVVRIGNTTDGVSFRSGTETAIKLAAKKLRILADKMDSESKKDHRCCG